MEKWSTRGRVGRRDFSFPTGNRQLILATSRGDDVVGQGDEGSPGSGGASPYLRRGLSFAFRR
jgi:hypothetical protein